MAHEEPEGSERRSNAPKSCHCRQNVLEVTPESAMAAPVTGETTAAALEATST